METNEIAHIRAKYRDRYLQIAFIVSGWSKEPEGQRHGCVLAYKGKYMLSSGFNGPHRTWPAHFTGPAPIIHAEINALINLKIAKISAEACFAYITKKPCEPCLTDLKKAGIKAIFWLQDIGKDKGQWVA